MLLKIGYIALGLLMSIIIIFISFYTINSTYKERNENISIKIKVVLGLLLWHGYMLALHFLGTLNTFAFPPRFAIFMIIPAFLFTGIFIFKNRNSQWIQNIPMHWLVFYQSFRIAIESLFVFTVAAGILHPNVTIEGYNYDMLFGLTALWFGVAAFRNKLSLKIIRNWNYLGLAIIGVIIFLFLTTIYVPQLYGLTGPLMPLEFTNYPFILVPGFLMPSAVFVHVLSIVQLRKRQSVHK